MVDTGRSAVRELVSFLDGSGEYDFETGRLFPDSYESMAVRMRDGLRDPSIRCIEVSFTSDGEPYRSVVRVPDKILPTVESMVSRIPELRG